MYAFSVEMHMPFEEATEKVMQAIEDEGLGIVSDVDVQAVMRKKLNEEIQPYRILGACAPALAKRAIEADPEAGALLPCNVIVREISPDLAGVTFMDPEPVFGLSRDAAVIQVGHESRALIEKVRDRLAGTHPVSRL